MKNLRNNNERFSVLGFFVPFCIYLILLFLLWKGNTYIHNVNKDLSRNLAQQSVERAAIQCYATEGFYPASVDYLIENYAIEVDMNKYYVEYQCFASNIMPTIMVFDKK